MTKYSVDSVFVEKVIQGAQNQGLDCGPMLLKHGMSKLTIKSTKSRVPLDSFGALTIDVMHALDDEMLGLTPKPQPLGSFSMMCRSVISARSLSRSLKRCANFWNLFNNAYTHRVDVGESSIAYVLTPIEDQTVLSNYVIESILSSIHRFHCWLVGQFIDLNSVVLGFAQPDYSAEYKSLFYGSKLHYGQHESRIEFSIRFLNMEIVQTPETLDKYLLGNNRSLLYQPKNYRVIGDQVRQWLEKSIKQNDNQGGLKQAAQHFQMSQQVLHRRLQAEGLSFKEIKMQTRRDISISLLFSNKYKIEDISTKVGFSEPSAFIRAFKSWTGFTPLAYRNEHRSNDIPAKTQ